jgi:hypothetical protein
MHGNLSHHYSLDDSSGPLWPDDVINAAFWVWVAALGGMILLTCWLFCFPLG